MMKGIKDKLSSFLGKEEADPEYIEVDLGQESEKKKVKVRPFILKSFDDVDKILNGLREGYTIAVVDISPLKRKDMLELKRVIAKIKKTANALEGEVAGFGEGMIIATPSFAEIYKPKKKNKEE
jgi:SepF-like predicted cell division protein (DUF552 family)